MGVVLNLFDRLTNVLTGRGTSNDRRTAGRYHYVPIDPQEAEAAYRTSWLVRKIIDIPPFDMTREGRDWQAEGTQIETIEAEEARLQLWPKLQRSLVLSRLYGGGALLIGDGGNTEDEIDPERMSKGGLKYMHVLSRHQLPENQPRTDPEDPWYGHPEFFTLTDGTGRQLKLHPSRVVAFVGQKSPEGAMLRDASWFWGDPLLQSIDEAVKHADMAQGGFASLIDEAKLDVIKMKDLTSVVATTEGQQTLMNKLSAMQSGKSVWRMLALDAEDDWQQRQITWSGIPETLTAFLQVVAGAADIPVTRLLGQSPKGLQSNGDGEERDYHSMVRARQGELLGPALDRIDPLLIRSSLGSVPASIYYEFAPLSLLSEKDAADVEQKYATAFKTRTDTGGIPDDALAKAEVNRMIESGRYPGLEEAMDETEKELGTDEEEAQREADLLTREQGVRQLEKQGKVTKPQADALITDAKPRSLYVRRDVLNGGDIRKWAAAQGITDLVPDLHVTLIYSRTPLDWMKAGNANEWSSDASGKMTIPAGGPRAVEPLGNMGAVLMFASNDLAWRHRSIVDAGASHDFDDYLPHISLTEAKVDAESIEPYRGKIVLGPEIFEEVKTDAI